MCDIATAALVASLIGAGTAIAGQATQAQAAKSAAEFDQEMLRNKQTVIDREIDFEKEDELLRQELLSQEGAEAGSAAQVDFAARGIVIDEGSALKVTTDIAGETALRKTLSQRESAARIDNLNISRAGFGGEIARRGFEGEAAGTKAAFGIAGTGLTATSKIASKFSFFNKKDDFKIGFRKRIT